MASGTVRRFSSKISKNLYITDTLSCPEGFSDRLQPSPIFKGEWKHVRMLFENGCKAREGMQRRLPTAIVEDGKIFLARGTQRGNRAWTRDSGRRRMDAS